MEILIKIGIGFAAAGLTFLILIVLDRFIQTGTIESIIENIIGALIVIAIAFALGHMIYVIAER